MATFPVTGAGVEMRESADGQSFMFGIVVDGVFVPFAGRKTGGIKDDLRRAAEAKAKAPVDTSSQG